MDRQQKAVAAGAQLILVIGGARSGKSAFAERLAADSGRPVAYIATATAGDEDMRARIQHHRASRPPDWQTIEEPLQLVQALQRAAQHADVIILDCMTVWLSNWLFAQDDSTQIETQAVNARYNSEVLSEIDAILGTLETLAREKVLIAITNEVGLGIVPAYALGRIYRDMLGRVNQRLAAHAARVYLLVAGLGVDIKRLHEEATL